MRREVYGRFSILCAAFWLSCDEIVAVIASHNNWPTGMTCPRENPTNTKYYVAVSACNMIGESRLSNEVIVSPGSQGSDN
jgi:hypothetical protein